MFMPRFEKISVLFSNTQTILDQFLVCRRTLAAQTLWSGEVSGVISLLERLCLSALYQTVHLLRSSGHLKINEYARNTCVSRP